MGHDKALYQELIQLLDPNGVIHFLSKTDMGLPFLHNELDPLRKFYFDWGDTPTKKFMNAELELYREELWDKVDAFLEIIKDHTFYVAQDQELKKRTVCEETESKAGPDQFKKVVDELESVGGDIVRVYNNLVAAAQKYL
jgi:hypothetical protein